MKRETGSVSVLLAGGMVLALVLTMGVTDLGRVLVARSKARTAADSAALAVAQELAVPTGADLVALADLYVSMNGARLTGCSCEPGTHEAIVETSVQVGDLLLYPGSPDVSARSRAVIDLPTT
jgi:uncharacterized membrane protein